MPIETNQIVTKPRLLQGQGSPPTTGSGRGAFFALDIGAGETEGAYADESGNVTQITNQGSLAAPPSAVAVQDEGGPVDPSVSTLNFTGTGVSASQTAPGVVEVNVPGSGGPLAISDEGSPVEASTTSIDVIGQGLEARSSGPGAVVLDSNEFRFNLPAAGSMAARIAGATLVPAGWILFDGTTSPSPEFGVSPDTLVIGHGLTKIAQEITVFEVTLAGPPPTLGFSKIDLTSPGVQKTDTTKTFSGVVGLQVFTDPSKDLIVWIKLF